MSSLALFFLACHRAGLSKSTAAYLLLIVVGILLLYFVIFQNVTNEKDEGDSGIIILQWINGAFQQAQSN